MNSLTDNALMLKVKAGDLDKMGLLFERYHRPLFGYLYHVTGKTHVSEDLVQSVFYRMLKYRHTFTEEGEFRSWMYHLARNVLADHVRKNKQMASYDDVANWAEIVGGGTSADESLEKDQEMTMLHLALGKLSLENRELLVMSRFQELKYIEIAQLLKTTEGAVKVRIHRALKELKEIFFQLEKGLKAHEL